MVICPQDTGAPVNRIIVVRALAIGGVFHDEKRESGRR